MKYSIICGSHRKNSQSLKAGKFIQKDLEGQGGTTFLLDLAENSLPQWDESFWDNHPKWDNIWKPIAIELQSSDAIIILAPEYNGMSPAALKNFFLFASKYDLGHKPGLIVAVSSGMGGSYPIAELRMSSYKNSRICYIPEHIILRNIENILNEQIEPKFVEEDRYVRGRITNTLQLLAKYAKALELVRKNNVFDYEKYGNGM